MRGVKLNVNLSAMRTPRAPRFDVLISSLDLPTNNDALSIYTLLPSCKPFDKSFLARC